MSNNILLISLLRLIKIHVPLALGLGPPNLLPPKGLIVNIFSLKQKINQIHPATTEKIFSSRK